MPDDTPTSSFLAKIIGAAAALIAAWLVQQAVSRVWQRSTGHEPPRADDEGDAGLSEVVIAAAVTGALVAISRVLATRGAAHVVAVVEANGEGGESV
ncbi:DUF4235 domain-containing protein [Cellulomonas sp. McL0617]|uniref:DUF4235 domain-containing protein n=1 Tax=Cellulomonas sp. McL0617 TaxID=3415675 RepID=UPI003CF0C6E4